MQDYSGKLSFTYCFRSLTSLRLPPGEGEKELYRPDFCLQIFWEFSCSPPLRASPCLSRFNIGKLVSGG